MWIWLLGASAFGFHAVYLVFVRYDWTGCYRDKSHLYINYLGAFKMTFSQLHEVLCPVLVPYAKLTPSHRPKSHLRYIEGIDKITLALFKDFFRGDF